MSSDYIKELGEEIISFLRSIPTTYNKEGLLVCLSGGVDSALNLKLCAEAVGASKVLAVIMEVPGLNKEEDMQDAVTFAKELGVPYVRVNMSHLFSAMEKTFPFLDEHSKKITLNRIRLSSAYVYATKFNYSVVSSGNYSEECTRPIILHGSGSGDCFPYTTLYKTEIYGLARYFKLPAVFLEKAPSDGFVGNYTDMDSIGKVNYSDVDRILHQIINKRYKANESTDALAIHLAILHSKYSKQLDFPTFVTQESKKREEFIDNFGRFPYEQKRLTC